MTGPITRTVRNRLMLTSRMRALRFTMATVAGMLMVGISVAEAAQVYVVQLSYKNRWDRAFDVHFAPIGGFGKGNCDQSLAKAVAEYGADLNAAFLKNFGTEIESFDTAQFVDGKCQAFDSPPGQTFNLKLSGQ